MILMDNKSKTTKFKNYVKTPIGYSTVFIVIMSLLIFFRGVTYPKTNYSQDIKVLENRIKANKKELKNTSLKNYTADVMKNGVDLEKFKNEYSEDAKKVLLEIYHIKDKEGMKTAIKDSLDFFDSEKFTNELVGQVVVEGMTGQEFLEQKDVSVDVTYRDFDMVNGVALIKLVVYRTTPAISGAKKSEDSYLVDSYNVRVDVKTKELLSYSDKHGFNATSEILTKDLDMEDQE